MAGNFYVDPEYDVNPADRKSKYAQRREFDIKIKMKESEINRTLARFEKRSKDLEELKLEQKELEAELIEMHDGLKAEMDALMEEKAEFQKHNDATVEDVLRYKADMVEKTKNQ